MKPTLVIGCHHKTGSCLLMQVMNHLLPRLLQSERIRSVFVGNPIERKLPLSMILNHYKGVDCYVNQWFEHPVDVSSESVRLVHFVRHPANWVRSAYLYHRKGAPADRIRWVEWRIFHLKGETLGYADLLNRLEPEPGLAIEAIRSYPEIIGTAEVAKTSSSLPLRDQFSLEQIQANFDECLKRFCAALGFKQSELPELQNTLRPLDLTQQRSSALPKNVTRYSSDATKLEQTLYEDSSFAKLFSQAALEMGFTLGSELGNGKGIVPLEVVEAILSCKSHLSTGWQAAERSEHFMREGNCETLWTTYTQQVAGCGHLMMRDFIQQVIDILSVSKNFEIRPSCTA